MYGKHFASMYEGSMVGAGATVFAVWGYCISKADRDTHTVDLNPTLLATIIGDSVINVERAIQTLCSPDPNSHNKDHEGRRLLPETGFKYLVVSHAHYRQIRTQSDKREYERDRKRLYRAKNKEKEECPDDVPNCPRQSGTPASVSVSESVSDKKGSAEGKKPQKLSFGEFDNVKLTEEELNKIVEAHGNPNAYAGIDMLSSWLASSGKRKKNHYACLNKSSWVWKRMKEEGSYRRKQETEAERRKREEEEWDKPF